MAGSLTVVGTGMRLAGQVTVEAQACMEAADKLYHVEPDSITRSWIQSLNATAESLLDCYAEGKARARSYEEMVERILASVRAGLKVCAAFYGHPGVFVNPSHESIRRAREEGFEAAMLPGISSLDCLVADLGVDPAIGGCQIFEATDFLVHRRRFDPRNQLVLLQVGTVGVLTWKRQRLWNREGLRILVDALSESYPLEHEVVVYETHPYPVCAPSIERVPLRGMPESAVTANSTLYVPPAAASAPDPEMLARLGISTGG